LSRWLLVEKALLGVALEHAEVVVENGMALNYEAGTLPRGPVGTLLGALLDDSF
jgi:hypothetical protein